MLPILQVLIALVVIVAIVSIVNSLLLEASRRMIRQRSTELINALRDLFNVKQKQGEEILKKFLDHSFIKKLEIGEGTNKLTWISSDVFAETLISVVTQIGVDNDTSTNTNDGKRKRLKDLDIQELLTFFEKGADKLSDEIQEAIVQLLWYVKSENSNQMEALKKRIMGWYEAYMDRVTERYKKQSRVYLFGTGLLLSLAFNFDILNITSALIKDDDLRIAYYQYGKEIAQHDLQAKIEENMDTLIDIISAHIAIMDANQLMMAMANGLAKRDSTSEVMVTSQQLLPIGWKNNRSKMTFGFSENQMELILWKIVGILLFASALAVGAPFWFDFLQKLVSIKL